MHDKSQQELSASLCTLGLEFDASPLQGVAAVVSLFLPVCP